ncbi:MAG TPA: polysaccharide pyruvyl transferase family protein [Gammaproteobacteria bacterium]|jgi:polysaccharide pyruvyl transferase WcaK-like protein
MATRVCVVGNFSGRNAGDAAILGGLLKDVTNAYGPLTFDVPTTNPGFVRRQYPGFDVCPVGLLPWNLSVKIFGIPIVRSILRSDIVLVTDAILFDRALFNPLYNYLSTMALVLPLAKRMKIPVVLYNVSLGPARTGAGRYCLRKVLDASDVIILRDTESLDEIPADGGYEARIRTGADCALSIDPPSALDIDRIIEEEDLQANGKPYITFNVNSYIDVFVRARGKRTGVEEFSAMIARSIDGILERLDRNIVVVVTQPMDMTITNKVLSKLADSSRIRLISNIKYTYAELAGVFSRAEIHVGMRTHSLILASSRLTPIVGIIATPKNRGYMRSIRQDERMIEFEDISAEVVIDRVLTTWENRQAIRSELERIIKEEKTKASRAAEFLGPYLGTEARSTRHAGGREPT